MRLRQEFRSTYRGEMALRGVMIASWVLAAAAVLIGGVSLWNWKVRHTSGTPATVAVNSNSTQQAAANGSADVASDDSGEFTPLPGNTLDDSEEDAVLRVRMQRGSLAALGLPVNEERAGEWIQVDLLVGNDGLPQAVRLAEEEN
jgi:hypothetical protein